MRLLVVSRNLQTENVENAIFEILKKIQAEAASALVEMATFRAETNARFERLEDLMRKQRRDMAGLLVVGKATAGTFAEDIAAVKKRIDALEAQGH